VRIEKPLGAFYLAQPRTLDRDKDGVACET
jgi:hypothetical protein